MGEDMLAKLEGWVETSGRALELRTARKFRVDGADFVEQSVTYADPFGSAQREGDVSVRYTWTPPRGALSMHLCLAIECKHSTSPWVAFYDGREIFSEDWRHWVLLDGAETVLNDLSPSWHGREPFRTDQIATHVVAAFTKDSSNPANNAVRQALSFALALRNDRSGGPDTSATMPVVTTTAPLFACRLDGDNQVILEQVDGFDVWGYSGGGSMHRVYVRGELAMERLSETLSERVRSLTP
jgi:hypothetical protein